MKYLSAFLCLFIMTASSVARAASDEWEDLFQELNKPDAQSAKQGQGDEPAKATEEPLTFAKPAESSTPQIQPADPTPVRSSSPQPELTPDVKALLAEDEPAAMDSEPADIAEAPAPVSPRRMEQKPLTQSEAGNLVDLNAARSMRNIDDLERRVADLEKDNRLLVEKIRNLTRTVDDLKRRR